MIEAKLERAFASFPNSSTFYIAFSGGLDSTVLLHAAKRAAQTLAPKRQIYLKAIHVHHGISENADSWSEHCQAVCARLDIPLTVEHVFLELSNGSFEGAARDARYAVFNRLLSDDDVLLMAHHEDDQYETVLMRIMRGGDSSLLAGIPECRKFDQGSLFRPFLDVRRAELEGYACKHGLDWVDDESNRATYIDRNRVRHEVVPRLLQQEPRLFSLLNSLVQGHRALNALSECLLRALYPKMLIPIFKGEAGLSLDVLRSLNPESQRDLFRWWLRLLALPQPGAASFERIWSELIPAKIDANPHIDWAGLSLRRYADAIFVIEVGDKKTIEHEEFIVSSSQCGWNELGKREKIRGRSKKEWQKRLKIPPWQRPFLRVCYEEGCVHAASSVVDVVDSRDGKSIFSYPASDSEQSG